MEESISIECEHNWVKEKEDKEGIYFRCSKCLERKYKHNKSIFNDSLDKAEDVLDSENPLLSSKKT